VAYVTIGNFKYPDVIEYNQDTSVDFAAELVLRIFVQQMENGVLESPQAQTALFQ
jgi:hypothetical protein